MNQDWEYGFKLLLQRPDIDPNVENSHVNTPLINAIYDFNENFAELLINHPNIDVNKASFYFEETPLHYAVKFGLSKIVKLLLQHPNIDVNKADYIKNTPLMFAFLYSKEDLADLLINHPNIDLSLKNSEGKTALQIAKDKKLTKSIELIEKKLYKSSTFFVYIYSLCKFGKKP